MLIGVRLLTAIPAHAATVYTWTNGAGNWTWDTTSKDWSGGGTAWVNSTATSQAVFSTAGSGAITVSSGIKANAITINSGATGYTFGGGGITLGSGGITANETATFNSPFTLGAAQNWSVASGKTLAIGGSVANGGHLLALNGSGTTNVLGAISGAGGLSLTTSPILYNTNSYTGGTTFNANTNATITNNQAFGPGALYFNGGGFQSTVPLTGALAVTNAWSVAPGGTGYVYGAHLVELTQGTTLAGAATMNVNNGVGPWQIDGAITGGFSLTKNGGGVLTLASTASTYSGGTVLPGGYNGNLDVPVSSAGPAGAPTSGPLGTGALSLGTSGVSGYGNIGNYTGTAAVTIGNPVNIIGSYGYDGGAYGITFTGPISLSGQKPSQVLMAHNVTFAGNISGTGFELWLFQGSNWNTGGVFTMSGSNSFNGGVRINQGTLALASSAALGNNSVFIDDDYTANTNDGSTALLIHGAYTIPNPVTVDVYGNGTYLGGNTADSSTFSGPVSLGKTATLLAASGGTANFSGVLSGAGGVTVGFPGYTGTVALGGSDTYSGGTTVAYGTLALTGSGAIAGTGTVVVNAGATLGGGGTVTKAPVVINAGGTLSPSLAKSLALNNTVTFNSGSNYGLIASGGSLNLATVARLVTSGTVNLEVTPLDATTLAGSNYTFLSWTASGPAAGAQSNWTIVPVLNAIWAGTADNNWGTNANWSGFQASGGTVVATGTTTAGSLQLQGATVLACSATGPTPFSSVFIQVPAGATVAGPASATTVASLALGSTSGSANTLTLGAGALSVTGAAGTTVSPTGSLDVSGGTLSTTVLTVGGMVSVGSGGSLTAPGAATVSGNLTSNGVPGANALVDNTGGSLAVTGTANFGQCSTVALPGVTVSGAGQFTAAGEGTITSLTGSDTSSLTVTGGTLSGLTLASGYAGTTTISSGATGPATLAVPGGTVNLNNTIPMTSLTVSGGTTTLGNGASIASIVAYAGSLLIANGGVVTAGTASFLGGGATVNTQGGSLAVTSQLILPGGVTFFHTGSSSLGASGANLAGASVPSTLTLSGGAVSVVSGGSVFGFAPGWQLNGGATLSGGTLTLTDDKPFEARSAFYSTKMPTTAFTASFVYQDVGGGLADGATFCFQNGGATAIGTSGGGSGLGFQGIATNAAALAINIWQGHQVGTAYISPGNWGAYLYDATGSVNVASGDPILVQLSYNGSTLAEMLTDQTTLATFAKSYAASIPGDAGGNVAYAGFTGGTGGAHSNQTVSNFQFSYGTSVLTLPNTGLNLTAATSFAAPSGAASTLGGLSFSNPGADLTFTGGNSATSLSFSGVTATASASVLNAPGDSTALAIQPGGTISAAGGQTLTIGVPIVDGSGSTTALVAAGPGTVVLTASNSYSDGTLVTGGTLVAQNAAAIPSGSLLAVGAGGSVVLGTPGAAEPLGLLSGGGSAGPLGSQPSGTGGGANPVPEPGTLALLAAAAACGLAAARRRRRGFGIGH